MATKSNKPATKTTPVAAAAFKAAAGSDVIMVNPKDLVALQQVRVKRTDDKSKAEYAAKVSRMAANMAAVGMVNPILVRKDGDQYIIIAGHTRADAAIQLEWPEVQVIVQNSEDDARKTIARQMSENLLRDNLTLLDQANGFQTMLKSGLYKNAADIARGMGMTAGSISKYLAISPEGEKVGKYAAMMLSNGFNDLEAAWMVNKIEEIDSEQAKEIAANHAKDNGSETRKTIKKRYDALKKGETAEEPEETDAEGGAADEGEEADPQAPAWEFIQAGGCTEVIRMLADKLGEQGVKLNRADSAKLKECLAMLELVEETTETDAE